MHPFDNLQLVIGNSGIGGVSPFIGDSYSLYSVIYLGVNVVIVLAIGISLIAIAYSFLKFIMSQGDPKAVQEAKTSLTWAVIAFLIGVFTFTIKTIVMKLFGINSAIL